MAATLMAPSARACPAKLPRSGNAAADPVNFMSRRRDRYIVPSTCFSFYQLIKAPWHCQLGGRKLFAVNIRTNGDRWNGEAQSGGRYRGDQFALCPGGAAL